MNVKKENVFIVLSLKNQLKKNPRTGKCIPNEWEVAESVEFVNKLRNKHTSMSSAIGDYINRKMISGARFGATDYTEFENYIRKKYEKQMADLDSAYRDQQVKDESPEVYVDAFGNVRPRTVFDPA